MSEFKKLHDFTDGNKTGQVFLTDVGRHRFMALLYQADIDYNDAQYFTTEEAAEKCAENWVIKHE